MEAYYLWFAAAVVLVIAELATGTFYLLMVALGVAAGGVAALLAFGPATQTVAAAVVATAAVVVLRRSRYGVVQRKGNAATDPNVNLDIGQELDVPGWDDHRRARVPYRGADWTVELAPDNVASPGRFRIVEVRGSTLIVAPR